MYDFLKMYVGGFWTLQIAMLLAAIAVACIAVGDDREDSPLGFVLETVGIIFAVDSIIIAGMALVMAMGI